MIKGAVKKPVSHGSAVKLLVTLTILMLFTAMFAAGLCAAARASALPGLGLNVYPASDPKNVTSSLQIIFLLALFALAPSLLLMMTSFTRILISLYFLRSALGTQQMPPGQILVSLALFLTLFLMSPIITQINDSAVKPYTAGQMSQDEAMRTGMEPLRTFMFKQVSNQDLALFIKLSGTTYATSGDIPSRVLIPAFMLSEITAGFKIGFILYLPFLAIDMVVASVLMAMGMMMLPPAMISLPFKILLFVMVDGWSLVIGNLMQTFK